MNYGSMNTFGTLALNIIWLFFIIMASTAVAGILGWLVITLIYKPLKRFFDRYGSPGGVKYGIVSDKRYEPGTKAEFLNPFASGNDIAGPPPILFLPEKWSIKIKYMGFTKRFNVTKEVYNSTKKGDSMPIWVQVGKNTGDVYMEI